MAEDLPTSIDQLKSDAEEADFEEASYALFEKEVGSLLNRLSMEQFSDTPDFILAEYLTNCLRTFADTTISRDDWWDGDDAEEGLHI